MYYETKKKLTSSSDFTKKEKLCNNFFFATKLKFYLVQQILIICPRTVH